MMSDFFQVKLGFLYCYETLNLTLTFCFTRLFGITATVEGEGSLIASLPGEGRSLGSLLSLHCYLRGTVPPYC